MAPETAVTGTLAARSKFAGPDVASGVERRFAVPESYGEDRVRIIAKDPRSLFAYWDLTPGTLAALRRQLGSRLVAVSPITLRLSDPNGGWASDVFVPHSGRSWHIPVDGQLRSVRAEVGLTLPSGEFRSLATSRAITPPRVTTTTPGAPEAGTTTAATSAPALRVTTTWAAARSLSVAAARAALGQSLRKAAASAEATRGAPRSHPSGASDAFGGGASDRLQG